MKALSLAVSLKMTPNRNSPRVFLAMNQKPVAVDPHVETDSGTQASALYSCARSSGTVGEGER
jgi:hypothetical protein